MSNKKIKFVELFKYEWILKNINMVFFIAFLIILYIGNGHFADKTIRKINHLNTQIKELKNEYKTVKAETLFLSEETQLLEMVKNSGLVENKELPYIIYIKMDSIK